MYLRLIHVFFNCRIQLKKLIDCKQPEKTYYGGFDWMVNTLLPKLCNWSTEAKLKTSVTSLRLIPIEDYSQKYRYLKEKYGKQFVEVQVILINVNIMRQMPKLLWIQQSTVGHANYSFPHVIVSSKVLCPHFLLIYTCSTFSC